MTLREFLVMLLVPGVIGSLTGFFTYRWGYRVGKRSRPLAPDVTVDMLDQALRIDRALEACQHGTAWVGHDHDKSPHVGVWLYEAEGRIHISSRYTSRDVRESGADAAEAIKNFRDYLLNEACLKEARLKQARVK